ncbi:MAG: TonB-dependent receptor [Acidobacteria bacterium]|nr:TonB-dependent receptor [Acidobacteriota bacterium]
MKLPTRLLAILLCGVFAARAQSILGSVSGTINDTSGALVPGAAVELRNLDTGDKRTVASQAAGNYAVPSLQPGRYTLTVSAAGFKTYTVAEFRLLVNESRTVNAELSVGDLSQAVTISGEPPAVNQVNATLSTTIQNREINQLPLNGRHFTQLLALSTGVVMDQGGQQNAFTVRLGSGGVSPVVNGMRPQSNNFTLDGIENNSRFTNTYAASPPPDAIQEFKVQTQDNDPGSAYAAGGNINVTTKSGTNQFHGAVWEFLRNDKLSANGFFNNYFGSKRVPYKQNQFGLVLGGPVLIPKLVNGRKSRTYFFGYWEGFESRLTRTIAATFPNQAVRNGDFSQLLGPSAGNDGQGAAVGRNQIYDILTTRACPACPAGFIRTPFPGNALPAARIDRRAKGLTDFFLPLPLSQAATLNHVRTDNSRQSSDQWGVRVDHSFSDNNRLFGRFSRYDADERTPQGLPVVDFRQYNTGLNAMMHFTRVFSPVFLADVQYGYNRTGIPRGSVGYGEELRTAIGSELAVNILDGLLAPQITYAGSPYTAIAPLLQQDLGNPEYSHQIGLNFSRIYSKHTLSYGFRYLRWNHIVGPQGNTGVAFTNTATNQPGFNTSGDAFASFLLGFPNNTTSNILDPLNTYGDVYVGYAGDVWKVRRNLSVNLGVQYVLATRPVDRLDRLGAFDFQTALTRPDATNFLFAYIWAGKNPLTGDGPNAERSLLLAGDHNNFAPRIGIAWSVTPKTVVRTGFGMYYDYNTSLVQNSVRLVAGSYPYGRAQRVSAQNMLQVGPLNPAITLANPYIPPGPVPADPAQTISRYLRDPYSFAWNFGIERLLAGEMVFSVHYVGGAGKNLLNTVEQNIAPAGPGAVPPRRPLRNAGTLFYRDNSSFSSYNSLQARVEKRYSRGLTFRNSFTWSRNFDLQSEANETAVEYVYNRDKSRGPSRFDRPIVNVTAVVWDVPVGRGRAVGPGMPRSADWLVGGWQLSGLVGLQSGVPYSIFAGIDAANTGTSLVGTRVADIGGNPFPSGFKRREAWFDRRAFRTPEFGTLGNTSRNMYRGPRSRGVTLSAGKTVQIVERLRLEFRSEFFNAFNMTNFGNPVSILTSPNFGEILGAGGGRDIQFGLKLLF